MEYRIRLASEHERDLAKAAALQEKSVTFERGKAAGELALDAAVPLDGNQRNRLRSLAVSVEGLGHIQRENGNPACVEHYREAIRLYQRVQDEPAEAVAEFNLGHAYREIPATRHLDVAGAAYQRSLELRGPNDVLGRSKCITQIGMVRHERFNDARERKEPAETLLGHAQAAEKHYLEARQLGADDDLTELAPLHNQLGNLYSEAGQLDDAREHLEEAAHYFEKTRNRFGAGQTRFNMALMYAREAFGDSPLSLRRGNLLRARAYAEAALRDFQHYEGRAAAEEARARRLLDEISQAIAKVPE